jgi:GrpB-like predicted nucleotidyltransferase (UPF0157 family)
MANEEPIYLKQYDPNWPKKFETEKLLVEKTLGPWIVDSVHHVGSTAVSNLSAKPIIDIMVGVENLEKAQACIPLLEQIGYVYFPYKPEVMHWFCKPSPAHREFHLYLMEPGSQSWTARLTFRNHLRTNPQTAAQYQALKEKLALKFTNDREAYTEAKAAFIRSVIQQDLEGNR